MSSNIKIIGAEWAQTILSNLQNEYATVLATSTHCALEISVDVKGRIFDYEKFWDVVESDVSWISKEQQYVENLPGPALCSI